MKRMNQAGKLLKNIPKLFRSAQRPFAVGCRHRPFQLVIFDKDGTLTCFSSMWGPWCEATVSRLQNASGKKIADDIYEFVNYDKTTRKFGKSRLAHDTHAVLKEDIASLLETKHGLHGEEAKDLVSKHWDDSFDIEGTELTHTVKPLGDVKQIFSVLRENKIKIAVCSSDSRESVKLALSDLGVLNMVDRLLCGNDPDNTAKPNPENVHAICNDLDVIPEHTVMIGDTHYDTVMGRRSNCGMVIGVLTGQGDETDLGHSDHTVNSIDEALPIILGHQESPAGHASNLKTESSSATSPFGPGSQSKRHFSTSGRYSEEFTHIIVGAGSAGCVLANRLSEDSCNSVLLVEAGPKDTILNSERLSWKIHMPAALTYNLRNDKYNWYYHTTPQKNVDIRAMYWPRGRVWGGSSSLNAMVYVRGHALDYDRWQEEGADDWDYDHCLPYFKKAQNHQLGADTYRGGEGPLHVAQGKVSDPLSQAFLEAAQQAGYPYTADMNGYQQEGFGPMDMTVHKGCRWSTATAYLRPALKRTNLRTMVNCLTRKLLFDGQRAVGIECKHNGQITVFRASEDVILCGGAINSPQLLMLSGVGNADDIRKLNIPFVQHLPGVGQNLQDHLEVQLQHKCKKPITLYGAEHPLNMIRIGAEWFMKQSGLGATNHLHAGGFIRSSDEMTHPDIQFHFFPSQYSDHGRTSPTCHAFQLHVGTLRDSSRGQIKLMSRNPEDHPSIDPNYFNTEDDIVTMRKCLTITREILKQKAFDELRGEEVRPGAQVLSDSQLDAFVRAYCETEYHPSCTCKMGDESDSMAVVNKEGKVFGLDNLRVVDASIMPSIVSGNLNAPTIMIAEKLADAIRGREALHTPNIPVYKPESM